MNRSSLRRAVSDVYTELDKLKEAEGDSMNKIDEVEKVECKCCGIIDDCTLEYIKDVRDSHCGQWICGLCSEAVKERLAKAPILTMEEAICTHAEMCKEFNTTTRLNPKLSLTCAMRDIAKRTSQRRNGKITRSNSCFAKIHLE